MTSILARFGAWLVKKFGQVPAEPTKAPCRVYLLLYAGDDPAKAKLVWEQARGTTNGRLELVVDGKLRGWLN